MLSFTMATSPRTRWIIALPLLVAAGVGVWYWADPQRRFERWLENFIRGSYAQAVGTNPAVELSDVKISTRAGELARGRVDGLTLQFRHRASGWRLTLKGPVNLNQNLLRLDRAQSLEVAYDARFHIEAPRGSAWEIPEFLLKMKARAHPTRGLEGLEIAPELPNWAAKPLSLTLDEPRFHVEWKEGSVLTRFGAKALTWQPDENRAVNLSNLAGELRLPLVLDPFVVGPDLEFDGKVENAEILWNEFYGELPLKNYPLRARVTLDLAPEHRDLPASAVRLELGPEKKPLARLEAEPERDARARAVRAKIEAKNLPLADLWAGILVWLPESTIPPALEGTQVTRGTLSFNGSGRAELATPEGKALADRLRFEGALDLRNAALLAKSGAWGMRGVNLKLPLPSHGSAEGALSVAALRFRRYEARVEPTPIRLTAGWSAPGSQSLYELELPQGLRMNAPGVPWKMGRLQAHLLEKPGSVDFWAGTQLTVGPVRLQELAPGLCLPKKRTPDAEIRLWYPNLSFAPGRTALEGEAKIEVFGGFLRVDGLKAYRLLSEVPEVQFSVRWNGIRLDEFGRWTRFGLMHGQLKGYARNVVVQGWLPTQYELRAELAPSRGEPVTFSAEAVDNVVRVLSGENPRAKMPSILGWLAFDVPDFFFPGFKLDWAGLNLTSRDGMVILEDHTPQEFVERRGQRFFMYGPRVKVPLNASTYPVVLDAHALANYTRMMAAYFATIQEESRAREAASQPGENSSDTDDKGDSDACLPDPLPER
ncbi:MAG: hypothetical protein IT285_02500 [Bdellovibrionales bacterium]|nr:hypothetical protein [Bdellovibrionales bacterium]